MKRQKRLNTVMDCVLITMFFTWAAAGLTYLSHLIDLNYASWGISHDFMWPVLFLAIASGFIPLFGFKDYLHNQCANDEQQAVLDITETIRMETEPHNWRSMWDSIHHAVRSIRAMYDEAVAASKGRLGNGLCNCHLKGNYAYTECRHLGCVERRTGIYSPDRFNKIGEGDMPDGDDAPVEYYVPSAPENRPIPASHLPPEGSKYS